MCTFLRLLRVRLDNCFNPFPCTPQNPPKDDDGGGGSKTIAFKSIVLGRAMKEAGFVATEGELRHFLKEFGKLGGRS